MTQVSLLNAPVGGIALIIAFSIYYGCYGVMGYITHGKIQPVSFNPNALDYIGADGHIITLTSNMSAHDPTYSELIEFIKNDPTDEHSYIPDKYTCGDFAETLQHNAENAGIKSGWVSIDFLDTSGGHACNVFNTTDKGLVFMSTDLLE